MRHGLSRAYVLFTWAVSNPGYVVYIIYDYGNDVGMSWTEGGEGKFDNYLDSFDFQQVS